MDAARDRLGQANGEAQQAAAAVESQASALVQATRRIDESRATLSSAVSQRQQVGVRQTQVDAARGRLDQALANLAQAELSLAYTTMRRADERARDQEDRRGRPGGAARPAVPRGGGSPRRLGGRKLQGDGPHERATRPAGHDHGRHLPRRGLQGRASDSIQAGSGAVFSLLPPENASGNFVKVVQRVPVKLVFDPGETARSTPSSPACRSSPPSPSADRPTAELACCSGEHPGGAPYFATLEVFGNKVWEASPPTWRKSSGPARG